ncbi:hypothetical protein Zmor_022445 [Zophobas morio]|uniref:BRCA1-associated ATM activator 1 n=1 Tax=Zophobas morio TaxID=2755281 RepID=A0AA38M6G7_9CUCU|nr:hypothetical protein Zmor_022445 [Zophobas morio]
MKPNVVPYLLKMQRLLDFFTQDREHNVAVAVEKFSSLLHRQETEGIESALVLVPLFTEWIKKAVTLWSVTGAKPRAPIVCFTVRIATMLSKNEEVFCELNKDSLFLKLIAVLDLREDDRSYLELLEGFLEHESGVEWIVAYDFWEDVFKSHCDESAHFIAKLLEKTIDREEFCVRVIKRLIGPVFSDCGSSSVALSAGVLENFLRRLDLRIPLLFYENCQSIPELSCDFEKNKVVYTLQMLELYKANDKSASANIDSAIDKIRATFISSICSRNFEHVIELCDFGQIYWTFVDAKISKLPHHTVFLIIPLLSPHFTLSMKYFPKADEDIDDLFDEYRKGYVDSMLSRMSHDSIRSCYKCRDGLLERAELFELAVASTGCLKRTRHLFCKDAAVMVFQTIVYILRDFVRTMKKFPETLANFGDQFDYFLGNFELLCLLVDDFGITWCDIYEIIYVLPASFDFLTMLRCPVDVTVQVLRLIDVTIAKSVAPNLTLLIDSTHNLFGPLLYVKLRDDVAEVRNVALAVIRTVARMAYIKFPSLQKVLMDSELPTLVVKMSTCDGESFVRATAIKCLQEMIQVEEIWNNALKTEDLSQKMRDILLNETEGIVRVEAATFMCVAYEHQQFPKDSLDAIYETMIYSSTTDLHWEVKVRALNFWDKVIKNHLQNQGMIDGSFPNVTFSKEHRKIVTLTDSEIRKRLLKVLGQLSAIGCLGVLTAAIKDDCDMEVSKTAVKITQKLVDLLKKYAVGGECSGPTSPIPTESGMSMSSGISVDESMDSPRSSQPDLNEEIIEQIVNAKDASLLKGVYAPSDYGSVSNYDFQVRKIVTPTEFLQFTHQDLNNIIAEKKKWLNGIEDLGSLLDDMLKTYDEDVNSMDCY